MKIILPEKVKFIIDTITAAGYEAFAVGGCVRDSVLGRKPDDWDITTSAKPEEIKALFSRTSADGNLQNNQHCAFLKNRRVCRAFPNR